MDRSLRISPALPNERRPALIIRDLKRVSKSAGATALRTIVCAAVTDGADAFIDVQLIESQVLLRSDDYGIHQLIPACRAGMNEIGLMTACME